MSETSPLSNFLPSQEPAREDPSLRDILNQTTGTGLLIPSFIAGVLSLTGIILSMRIWASKNYLTYNQWLHKGLPSIMLTSSLVPIVSSVALLILKTSKKEKDPKKVELTIQLLFQQILSNSLNIIFSTLALSGLLKTRTFAKINTILGIIPLSYLSSITSLGCCVLITCAPFLCCLALGAEKDSTQ